MGNSSDEDTDISDSDVAEYKEKTFAQLQAGKMKVQLGENAFRCPFCPGKMKQNYNLKDLLQHATGIGAAHKRTAKVRATHLGLAKYLEKDLAISLEKPLQIVPYKPQTPKDEEKFVWPWMGIVVNINIPPHLTLKESEDRLKAQFSRFRPDQVTILENVENQTLCAIFRFSKQWSGFNNALAFEKHFKVEKYGKADWIKINCRKDDLYGWFARSEDYNSPGPIGVYLRNNGDLRSIADLERAGLQETEKRVAYYTDQIEEKNEHLRELELQNNMNGMKLQRMMEDKDKMVEDHNKKIIKMQEAACKSSANIIAENAKLSEELWIKKQEINRRSKTNNKQKLDAVKHKNEKDNGLLDVAILKQEEAHKDLLRVFEKHKAETDAALAHKKELELKLTSRHQLELEIEQLKGKLEVMKHLRADEEDTKLKEIETMLEEKDEELEDMESLNQTLIIKQRRATDELEDAKKDLISHLLKVSGARSHIGVKRMGELDGKAFCEACKEKREWDDDTELAIQCSKWEAEIGQPEWHPFKVIVVDGQEKVIRFLLHP